LNKAASIANQMTRFGYDKRRRRNVLRRCVNIANDAADVYRNVVTVAISFNRLGEHTYRTSHVHSFIRPSLLSL